MSTTTTPPKGSMYLYGSIDPPLDAGKYRLTVGDAPIGGATPIPEESFQRYFDIDAPRLTLPATEVAGVFPPRNARGAFSESLAHVALGRRTLPYEREHTPVHGARIPWLALLLLEDSEYEVVPNVALSSIVPPAVYQALAPAADEVCTALKVPLGTLFGIMPSRDELRLLTHVRQVNVDDRELAAGDSDGWFAIVLSNRIPEAGKRYRACLVSVERRTDVVPQNPLMNKLAEAEPEPHDVAYELRLSFPHLAEAETIDLAEEKSLVLLYSWEFTCEGYGTFFGLMQALDVAMIGSVAETGRPTVTDTGHLPISVRDRAGVEQPSWYRGPCVPHQLGRDTLGPYHSADQARRVDPVTGAEDVSYAAAFELGRLIAMADGRLAQELAAWRRRAYARAAQLDTAKIVPERLLPRLAEEFFEEFALGLVPAVAVGALTELRKGTGPIVDPWALGTVSDAVGLQPEALMEAWNLSSVADARDILGLSGAGTIGVPIDAVGRTDRGDLPLGETAVLGEHATRLQSARDNFVSPALRQAGTRFGVDPEALGSAGRERFDGTRGGPQ